MDFAYDKLQAGGEETPDPDKTSPQTSIDKAADRLESGLERTLEQVSNTQNWSSWWSNIKERGNAAFQETLQETRNLTNEFTQGGAGDSTVSGNEQQDGSSLAASTETVTPTSESGTREAPGNNTTMMDALANRAQAYIDNLDKDLEKIELAAGSYFSKVGKDFKSIVKEAITVAGPNDTTYDNDENAGRSPSVSSGGEDLPSEVLFNVPEDIRNQIYSTRLDAQLHALHTSTDPFLTTTKEAGFDEFSDKFDISKQTDEIAKDLEKYPQLRSLMESLVPHKVSYDQFWTKYYYMRKQLSEQEQKRKELLSQANQDESAEVAWDDDEDEEDEEKKPEQIKDKKEEHDGTQSKRPSSESSYDLVSKNSSVADLKKTEEARQDVGADDDDDDDDDDWE